jgi:hypothetical protein
VTPTPRTLESTVVRFTWSWALIFLPIETYLSFWEGPISVSGYVVNVVGVGITLWAVVGLRQGRPYAEGLLATGLGLDDCGILARHQPASWARRRRRSAIVRIG